MQGRNWRVLDLAERGDLEAMRLEIERHEELADRLRLPTYQWWGPMWRTTLAILEGRWTEAEELLERFRATGRRAHDANAELYFELQRHGLALERERTSEVDESMLDRQLGGPVEAAYRSGYAWVCALEGRDDEARRHLHWVTADALARLPEDMNRLAALCELAQACALLGESAVAPSIHEQLAPYAERHVINARASAGYGAAAHHLGELAVVMSQPTKARVHFEDALRVNAALGSRPWLARTQLRYGELLLAEGAAQDRPRAVELLDAAWAAAADLGLGSVARRAEARLSEPAPPAPVRSC